MRRAHKVSMLLMGALALGACANGVDRLPESGAKPVSAPEIKQPATRTADEKRVEILQDTAIGVGVGVAANYLLPPPLGQLAFLLFVGYDLATAEDDPIPLRLPLDNELHALRVSLHTNEYECK